MRLQSLAAVLLSISSTCGASVTWRQVGWDAYRKYDLHYFRPGEITRQFSSYDHTNGNDDGSHGTYSCFSTEDDGSCVIASHEGPGEIDSIWFTYDVDSVRAIGNITIYLDSNIVLDDSLQRVVDGDLGAPFVWPFVGNTNDTSGGNVIKVPMPYRKGMKVVTEHNPHYYHVVYRTFPEDVRVKTFDPSDRAWDVIRTVQFFGVRDPKTSNAVSASHSFKQNEQSKLAPGKSSTTTVSQGEGVITQFQFRVPEILGGASETDDGRAFGPHGGSSVMLQLDPNNDRCSLTRRVDRSTGNQKVSVTVDGQHVGMLFSGTAQNGVWDDQVLDLDPSTTRHKSTITVGTEFISSDTDANEFMYALHCVPLGSWSLPSYGPSMNWTLMDLVDIGPNNIHDEKAHQYQIHKQTWQGVRELHYTGPRQMRKQASQDLLSNVFITMTFDDNETVRRVPIGSFFGTSLSKTTVRSLLLSVDAMQTNGAFTSYFPMPMMRNATITIENDSTISITPDISLTFQPSSHLSNSKRKEWGYFSTQNRRGPTTPGQVWPVLSTNGPGVSYGLTHTICSTASESDTNMVEGDFQAYIDRTNPPKNPVNSTSAIMLGTGTEDFYESGWFFSDGSYGKYPGDKPMPYDMPFTGLAGKSESHTGRQTKNLCLDMHRLLITDSIPFGSEGISLNFEHGGTGNDDSAEFETTAFYYK
ncbi:hypothetical protein PHISCL_07425 [Aspergillus sclerotialis]|uniref:Uncharacterized protein n=1 Tax=Aspergillus sclerotialis TaxID=2070753 RepID=A0A3A2ZFW4_9EURO|nr:hypothetical protein PHISCL_07425 [Aspergillus sclerotialis]